MAKKKLTKKVEVVKEEVFVDDQRMSGLLKNKGAFIKETAKRKIRPPVVQVYWKAKTFFDFKYDCCHPDIEHHCIECYNKARKG